MRSSILLKNQIKEELQVLIMNKIGIIAGGGSLPIIIGKNLIKKNFNVIFFVIEEFYNINNYENLDTKIINLHSAKKIIQSLIENPLEDALLNINIPDVDYGEIKGFKVTRLGNRHKSEAAMESFDPKGRKVYWVGPVGAEQDAGEGTDFHAIRNKYVSITPIQIDLTRHRSLTSLSKWIEVLN